MTVIDSIVSDGGGDWRKKTAVLPAGLHTFPAGRKSAARDSRFIEIFGAGGGPSWVTYDTIENTIAPRAFSGDVPTRPVFFAAPCGNGSVIIATAGAGQAGVSLSWYRVNATTGVTAAIGGGPCQPDDPTATGGNSIVGDLIQTNVVLLAVFHNAGGVWRYFAYHVDSNSFEAINIVGQGPEAGNSFDSHFDLCMYQSGEAVIVSGDGVNRPVSTTLLNYATRSFKRLGIPQPNTAGSRSNAISHFRLANINGRPQLVADLTRWDGSGQPNYDLDGSFVWELTPGDGGQWRSFATNLPARWAPTIASLLSNGLARGNGYFSGGQVPFSSTARNDIWEFAAGGIIETEFEGQVGLTLRPGTDQATFKVLNVPNIGWEVAKALVEPRGFIPPGSVRVRLSLDGGANFQEMPLRKIVDILNSTDPAQRVLEMTLLSSGSTAPVLTDIIEAFERPAGPGLTGLHLRYRVPAGTKGTCLSREGLITFEAVIAPTVPDKAILNKTAGVLATYKEYENRRNLFKDFIGAKAGGVSPVFTYDFARPPKKIRADGVQGDATGPVYKIANPVIAFDGQVAVGGLAADGDNYIVEVFA